MKLIIEIPEKTNAHIRSDFGHFVTAGVMALREEDKDILCYAIYHGKPYEEPHYGKWIIAEVRCPYCLEYFDTDAYDEGNLGKCPCCGKDMERR